MLPSVSKEKNRHSVRQQNDAGYSLTEVLIALIIISVLLMLAIPVYNTLVRRAKQTEAKTQLQFAYTLQKSFKLEHDRYAATLKELGFEQQKLISDGGQARYRIELVEAGGSDFVMRAVSVVDFDDDGVMNVYRVDGTGVVVEEIED